MSTIKFHVMSFWAAFVFILAVFVGVLRNKLVLAILIVSIMLVSLSACSSKSVNPVNAPMSSTVEKMLAGDNPQNVLSGGN